MSEAPTIGETVESKVASPIVIVGCQRSGTTLLRTMLNNHPGLLVHPDEPQFFLELARRFGNEISDVGAAVDLVSKHPYRAATLSRDDLDREFGGSDTLTLREFSQRYLTLWCGDSGDRRLVIKHPYLVHHLDLVFDLFPGATVVHMVRDPRANVSSTRARWKRVSVLEGATLWNTAVSAGHSLALERPGACIEVGYERLVQDSEETLRTLCEQLAIPFSPTLLSFEMKTWSYAPGETGKEVRYEKPDPARLTVWKSYLSPLDIQVIESCCADEMDRCGYERVDPDVSDVAFLMRMQVERLRCRLKMIARRIRRRSWKRQ